MKAGFTRSGAVEICVQDLAGYLADLRHPTSGRVYEVFHNLTVIDEAGAHFRLVYHLESIAPAHQLWVEVLLERTGPGGSLPEAPTATRLWSAAIWHEREAYDLFGIRFVGHTNLRRVLCPQDWEGHAMRRDYQPPTEVHGISHLEA